MHKNKIEKIINQVKNIKTNEIIVKYNTKDFKGGKIMTFGTFDLFHIGHKKIIDHALEISGNGENLIIAVSSDKWNNLKGKNSEQNQFERFERLKKEYPNSTIIYEDHSSPEESWPQLWDEYEIDLIVMGGDHVENLSYINKTVSPLGKKMKISFFERTPKISSTLIRGGNK